jgi:hypothetical protein
MTCALWVRQESELFIPKEDLKMKRIVIMAAALIAFTAATAMAQMGGHGGMMGGHGEMTGGQQHPGMMSSQHSQQMMGQQMMHQNMMRDMTRMMSQMNQMMQTMSHTMYQERAMDHTGMQEMSQMMKEMSVTMGDMSEHMAQGTMDPALTNKMQERMKTMNQMMENIQKEGN